MPIKWSALAVSNAADNLEKCFMEASLPLAIAKGIVRAALEIPDIPNYIKQRLMSILSSIEGDIGGSRWQVTGRWESMVSDLRKDLPADAMKAEQKRSEMKSLV